MDPRFTAAVSPQQLFFRPAGDEAFLHALRRVNLDSLDHETRQGIATEGVVATAREDLECYRSMPGDREWWRLAYTADGALAGLAIPSANDGGAVVGYLGVVPAARGHGLVDEVLAEITRMHAMAGAGRIVGDTDLGNVPMAGAFWRGGYRHFATRMVIGPW